MLLSVRDDHEKHYMQIQTELTLAKCSADFDVSPLSWPALPTAKSFASFVKTFIRP